MSVNPPRIHIESVGAGPPLLLLHGFGLHGGLFAPILPALALGHRVHVADLPGHGHSAPLTILGWSMGGAIALHWAASQPGRIAQLALVCTTPSFVVRDGWPHAMTAATLAKFGDELTVAYKLTLQRFLTLQVQGSEQGRVTLARLRHELFARGDPSPAALAESLALLARIDLRDEVRAVRARCLVVTGNRDTLAPAAAGAWLANALPDARLVEIDGAAHAPFLSHRDLFLAALADFIDA